MACNPGSQKAAPPQGGVISPLLANLYLNPLDWLLVAAGLEAVRYADDMVVLCKDRPTAGQALEQIRRWMEEAGLELHPEKTRLVDMTEAGSHFDFLGYRFWRSKKGMLKRFVRPKSRTKLRERLHGMTRRNTGHSLETVIARINPVLRGWYQYFRHASRSAMEDTDKWVRARLRAILRRRKGGRGRGRGVDHQKWNNRYFADHGLYCLVQVRERELASLRPGVTC